MLSSGATFQDFAILAASFKKSRRRMISIYGHLHSSLYLASSSQLNSIEQQSFAFEFNFQTQLKTKQSIGLFNFV